MAVRGGERGGSEIYGLVRRGGQCLKWRFPVKTMAIPAASAAAMTSSSRMEPPGWIQAEAPASMADWRPSAKGNMASDATTEPFSSRPASRAFPNGDPGGIDTAHLSGSDAKGAVGMGIDDGVGFDVFDDAPSEDAGPDFLSGGGAFGDDFALEIVEADAFLVAVHDHEATGAGTDERRPFRVDVGVVHFDEAKIFLFLEEAAGVRTRTRGR